MSDATNEIQPLQVDYTPAEIICDFDSMKTRLQEILSPYENLTSDMVKSISLKDAKNERAYLNRLSKELNDSRKAIKKAYNQPLQEFEARVKEIDEMIKEPLGIIDEVIKEQERLAKEERRERLQQAYEDLFPALVPVVPLDRVIEPQWLNKTYGEIKAIDSLTERVSKVAEDWQSLQKLEASMPFYDEAEREFFRTLSLADAIKRNDDLVAESERIEQLKADVQEAQAYQAQEHTEPAAEYGQEPVEPISEPEIQAPITPEVTQEQPTEVRFVAYMTASQVNELIAWFRERDIHGTFERRKHG